MQAVHKAEEEKKVLLTELNQVSSWRVEASLDFALPFSHAYRLPWS